MSLRDLFMVFIGIAITLGFYEFSDISPLNELREEYAKVLTFSAKHGYSTGLPCLLDDLSCGSD